MCYGRVERVEMSSAVESVTSVGAVVDTVTVQIGPQFLELFSEHMYSSPNKAFEELVSNSWDAGARVVHIGIPPNLHDESAAVWVLDDGVSMDVEGFKALWAVATSNKPEIDPITNRPQIGKFGIGKLATYLLAHQLTYLCKAHDGVIRAVTMDYRRIEAASGTLHIDPIPLEVRELSEAQLAALLREVSGGDRVEALIRAGVTRPEQEGYEDEFLSPDPAPRSPSGTWTLALLTALKPAGQRMEPGRIRWILRTALPLGESLVVVFNDEVLPSSKVGKPVSEEWVLGPGLGITSVDLEGSEIEIDENSDPHEHLFLPGIGVVTGRVRLYEERISGGKSEAVGASNGFFVNILGRVVNWDDPYFGLENLNHSAWSRFRATVRADGLNRFLAVNREGLQETQEVVAFRAFLLALFNKARAAYNAAEKAAWPHAGDVLTESWGLVPLAPLRRVVASALEGGPTSTLIDLQGVADLAATKQAFDTAAADRPGHFISEVVLEERAPEEPFAIYEVATRRIVVNRSHPFSREHGETREQQLLLRDAAFVEVLTTAFLIDAGVPPDVVADSLAYRDETLRLVARVRRRSGAQIAELLLEATAHVKGFETIVGDALEYFGFDVDRKGASGEPEGVATAPLPPGERDANATYRFTYDAKSSKHGKSKTGNVGTAGLERHRKDWNADYILVVSPGFEEGGLEKECAPTADTPGITPIKAADLGELLMASAAFGRMDLVTFRSLFDCHSPAESSEWVAKAISDLRLKRRVSLGAVLEGLELIGFEGPDAPTVSVLAHEMRERTKADYPTRTDIARVIDGLAILAPGLIRLVNERIILGGPPRLLRDAIREQIASIPTEFRFGLDKELDGD